MRVLLAVVVLALAGCTSDGDDTAVTTTSSSSSPTSSSTTTSTSAAPRAQGDTGSGPFTFRMPSGNIWCAVTETDARCDITDKTWSPPPKPADCDLDWGDSMAVTARGAVFVCAGDSVQEESAPVLAYGGVVERGDIRCRSAEEGVTCEHRPSGSRFLLSKSRYERD